MKNINTNARHHFHNPTSTQQSTQPSHQTQINDYCTFNPGNKENNLNTPNIKLCQQNQQSSNYCQNYGNKPLHVQHYQILSPFPVNQGIQQSPFEYDKLQKKYKQKLKYEFPKEFFNTPSANQTPQTVRKDSSHNNLEEGDEDDDDISISIEFIQNESNQSTVVKQSRNAPINQAYLNKSSSFVNIGDTTDISPIIEYVPQLISSNLMSKNMINVKSDANTNNTQRKLESYFDNPQIMSLANSVYQDQSTNFNTGNLQTMDRDISNEFQMNKQQIQKSNNQIDSSNQLSFLRMPDSFRDNMTTLESNYSNTNNGKDNKLLYDKGEFQKYREEVKALQSNEMSNKSTTRRDNKSQIENQKTQNRLSFDNVNQKSLEQKQILKFYLELRQETKTQMEQRRYSQNQTSKPLNSKANHYVSSKEKLAYQSKLQQYELNQSNKAQNERSKSKHKFVSDTQSQKRNLTNSTVSSKSKQQHQSNTFENKRYSAITCSQPISKSFISNPNLDLSNGNLKSTLKYQKNDSQLQSNTNSNSSTLDFNSKLGQRMKKCIESSGTSINRNATRNIPNNKFSHLQINHNISYQQQQIPLTMPSSTLITKRFSNAPSNHQSHVNSQTVYDKMNSATNKYASDAINQSNHNKSLMIAPSSTKSKHFETSRTSISTSSSRTAKLIQHLEKYSAVNMNTFNGGAATYQSSNMSHGGISSNHSINMGNQSNNMSMGGIDKALNETIIMQKAFKELYLQRERLRQQINKY
ncbi:UNKNOWN [Stylonychia lemnae]|uniref:Uncharacterized protein n=1 Tax=Stylonychia lemnae TaxID=5949 RepID=A0A078B4G6_STYLE|nr:UNKNOWN [Stylonychia lemnae]|eukprot:CDW89410.1 UNKNOWN [Stylonychia lemnae]